MEFYYISKFDTYQQNSALISLEGHFVYLDEKHVGSEYVFICAKFRHVRDKIAWEAIEGVDALPHPFDAAPIHPRHAEHLKHWGVTGKHRTIEAAEQCASFGPSAHVLMRFSGI